MGAYATSARPSMDAHSVLTRRAISGSSAPAITSRSVNTPPWLERVSHWSTRSRGNSHLPVTLVPGILPSAASA